MKLYIYIAAGLFAFSGTCKILLGVRSSEAAIDVAICALMAAAGVAVTW